MKLAKTDARCRHSAIEQLVRMRWVRYGGVTYEGLEWARDNEDDFDACLTAAALLRCCLEELPFSQLLDSAARAEGGILGSGSINVGLPEATYRFDGFEPAAIRIPGQSAPRSLTTTGGRRFSCPIPGCAKVFVGSRGGWDGHVGSPHLHPLWHPDVTDPERRRHLFRMEYSEFFAS